MKVPYSWLKDFVDIDNSITPQALADKLVSAGFEVEEIIDASEGLKGIVVGKIIEISKHPQADKLLICIIDIGEKTIQIVTGANNIKVGDFIPVCLDGGSIFGKNINKGELRGVLSEGMLCGGSELDLTESDFEGAGVDGIFILGKEYPIGTDINEILGTNDYVLDIAVTANRPDCNSILGIAREVAAILNTPLKDYDFSTLPAESGDINDFVKVDVQDSELCPRYMAKAVKDIKVTRSPLIIRNRLRLVGLRPINNIVDITNYVLIELGQPMHAFDKENLEGGEIIVRRAGDREKISTLDGKLNTLNNSNLVICDINKPVALAGIMGGLNSGITEKTNIIILESARFKRDNIRKSSKALGLRSDSSSRFEKGIDFLSQELAVKRAVQLITAMGCGVAVKGVADAFCGDLAERTLCINASKVNQILGISVPISVMADILNRLQLVTTIEEDNLIVKVPVYREDIVNANDIAEEVIRLYGYDNIVNINLDGFCQTRGGYEQQALQIQKIKRMLSGESAFCEMVTYSFISPNFVKMLSLDEADKRTATINLINPLGEELSIMRTTLMHSMLATIAYNNSRGNHKGRLFEIGRVYFPKKLPLDDIANEYETLAVASYGEYSGFYELKTTLEMIAKAFNIELKFKPSCEPYLHPGRSADVFISSECVGYIGEIHPTTAENYEIDNNATVSEINLELFLKHAIEFLPFKPIPKYPAIERDLAFVLDNNIVADTLLEVIKGAAGELLESIKIFDVYAGKGIPEGKKSIAVNLLFRDPTRTLVDEEVVRTINNVLEVAKAELNAVLRA